MRLSVRTEVDVELPEGWTLGNLVDHLNRTAKLAVAESPGVVKVVHVATVVRRAR